MNKTDKVFLLSNIVLTGLFIAVIFHYFCANFAGLGYPYNTFLIFPSYPEWVFGDFTWIMHAIKGFTPFEHANFVINYFPLAYILLFPFSLIKNVLISYSIFISIFLTGFYYLNNKFFSCKNLSGLENFQNIFIFTVMTYPVLFILERGNFDMILLFFICAFIYSFKSKKYISSAVLLAVINAFKPFTFIFWILFAFEKKWKELFFSLGLCFLLIILGFVALKGDFINQLLVYKVNLSIFQDYFVYGKLSEATNSSSLFLGAKQIICSNNYLISTFSLSKIFVPISLFITIFTVYFSWKEKVFWKKITLLTLYTLTVPYIIFDYKLILMFIPIWLFVNEEKKSKFDLAYVILFGLLLIPKKAIWLGKLYLLSVTLNPLLMLGIMVLIIYEQIKLKDNI